MLRDVLTDRGDAFADLARRYPDGVTVPLPGRPLHVLSDAAAIKHILVDAADRYEKGMGQAEARAGLGHGILTGEGERWARARSALTPQLKARAVQQHTVTIHRLAVASVDQLALPHTRAIPVDGFLADYTMRSLAAVLHVQPPPVGPVVEALDVVQDDAMFRAVTQDRVPAALRPRATRKLRQARTTLDHAADRVINEIRDNVGDDNLPAWADRDGVISLFLAGYETTASTLGWSIDFLSRRPALAQALADERAAVADPQDDPTDVLRMMSELPLTNALVKEVLRCRPPVWMVSRRARIDDNVAGWPVAAGDDVCVVMTEVHKDGWDTPEHFDPNRFLTRDDHGRYLPFGLGPRGCPGGSLANMEATLWLAEAARRLTFQPVVGRATQALSRMSMTVAPGTTYLVSRRPVVPQDRPAPGDSTAEDTSRTCPYTGHRNRGDQHPEGSCQRGDHSEPKGATRD